MNYRKTLLPLIFTTIGSLLLTGCGKNKNPVGGEKLIQIRAYKGGYGTDFLHEMTDQYHKAHPEVSFQFLEESALLDGDTAVAEISVPKKNQVDLYVVTGVDINYLLKNSFSSLRKRDVVLLEPLDDIFEGKAVGLDGKEEEQTIKSRFFDGFEELCKYDGEFPKWRGKMFTLPWAEATTGIFMNKAILNKYGIAEPLTSNEFMDAIETVSVSGASENIYPFSWGGENAAGYWQYLFETWFAQYSGTEAHRNFMRCDPNGSGQIVENGYKVYEDVGILRSLQAMYPFLDFKYSPNGSNSQSHMEAQTDFLTGKTAFMINGDWILNEMKEYYYEEGKEIQMLRAPILSSIGQEIGITDFELHTLVEYIDAHKNNAEIKGLMPALTDEKINWVRDARSVHDTIGVGHNLIVPSYSDAKDAVKDFLRFFYSNDGCRIFRNFANANLPLSYETKEGDTNTSFQLSLDKVRNYDNPKIVTHVAPFNGVRDTASPTLLTFNCTSWATPYTFVYIMLDKINEHVLTPEGIFTGEQEYVRSHWSDYMENIDYL